MEENKNFEPQYAEEDYDEIDIMELLRKLFKDWRLILKWCGIAAVVGLVVAFSIPKEYTVNSKLAPEVVSRSGGGNLSSLASLAGINLSSMSTSDAVYPEIYPDIVASTPFVVELFPVQVDFKDKKEALSADYYTYLKEYTHGPWWGKVVQFPFKALGWFMGLFREKEEKVEGYASLNPAALTQEQEDIAKAIRESVSLVVDKKTSVISLTVVAQDPKVAARISEEVIDRLQTYVTNYRTEKSRQDLEYYERLYDESKEAYFTAQQRYASYVDRNQGVILQRVKTEQERLQNEMNINYQLYNACAQQLQTAKAKVQQETPVFTIINPPQVPLKRSKPSKPTILLASIFLGAVVAAVWILWGRDVIAGFKKKDEDAPADEAVPDRK
ncbi:MAG: chain-length determining protein [Bacteroidales bacterium]|nr:chain-length determining protein [Bacteroidales bacterium]